MINTYERQNNICNTNHLVEVVKPIAALLSDTEQGPFRLLIIDSIIGKQVHQQRSRSLTVSMKHYFELSSQDGGNCQKGNKNWDSISVTLCGWRKSSTSQW
jgi:hypothetical protein